MSSSFFNALPLEQQKLLDRLCDDFERAWRAEEQPAIERLLEQWPAEHRGDLLPELVELEVPLRRELGEQPLLAEYQARFPDHAAALAGLACFAGWPLTAGPDRDTDATVPQTVVIDPIEVPRPADRLPASRLEDQRIGSTIGSYRILEKLGQGGMGEVYRVAHELIDCQRALKTLRPQLASHPEAVQRFLREAQASVRHLQHPHLVTVYDVSRDGDTVYLVMELVDGVDLSRLVEREGPLTLARAAELIRQAAAGLQFAHERGYVHRDIKPHNIMVTHRGEVKILDMGLVRVLDAADLAPTDGAAGSGGEAGDFDRALTFFRTRLTGGGALLGTLPYMSPEQAADPSGADVRSDIYSLGCTFYHLLTGRHAFSGSSVEEVLGKHLAGEFPPLRQARPEVPQPLEQIVLRMLHRDVRERYASAAQVQAALEQWLGGGPARVRLKDADELRRGLIELGLVSEDDWRTAVLAAARSSRATWRGEGLSTITMSSLPGDDAHPAIILQKLQELQTSRGGQKYGLSEFQVRMVLSENADLLRLPQHVLLDQIGGGWKGELYKARNIAANRTEVVRLFPERSLIGLGRRSGERRLRFEAHAERLRGVCHPQLARTLSDGWIQHRIHGETAVLAGEYLVGESLETHLATGRHEPERWPTLEWVAVQSAGVARGLDAAHAAGVLHLDITARSLRVDRDCRLCLTDLGVAALVREMPDPLDIMVCMAQSPAAANSRGTTREKLRRVRTSRLESTLAPPPAAVGTPEVQAPELFRDPRAVSPAADLYSFGCCLFYLLTGSYPFTAEGSASAVLGHLTRSPWDSPAAAQVPAPFRAILDRLLAKEPGDRYPAAASLAEALDALLGLTAFPRTSRVAWDTAAAGESAPSIQPLVNTQHAAETQAANPGWLDRLCKTLGIPRSR